MSRQTAVLVICCLSLAAECLVVRNIDRQEQELDRSFRRCCTAHGMPADCAREMCSYTSFATPEAVCKYTEKCTSYASEWLYCAMDKHDVRDCVREHSSQRRPIPEECYALFASGRAPSLNEIFENALIVEQCLERRHLFNFCYQEAINGNTHGNVCLEPGPQCKKFDHALSEDGDMLYHLFVFYATRGC